MSPMPSSRKTERERTSWGQGGDVIRLDPELGCFCHLGGGGPRGQRGGEKMRDVPHSLSGWSFLSCSLSQSCRASPASLCPSVIRACWLEVEFGPGATWRKKSWKAHRQLGGISNSGLASSACYHVLFSPQRAAPGSRPRFYALCSRAKAGWGVLTPSYCGTGSSMSVFKWVGLYESKQWVPERSP